jgi:hypothetical protein
LERNMVALTFRFAMAVFASAWAAGLASAQTPAQQSLLIVKDRVPAGDVVYVTDTKGVTHKGRLTAVFGDAVELTAKSDRRAIAGAEISLIQWQKPDSVLTGVVIGAAIGAIPGVYWLLADPNECTGMCPEDYAAIALGATVGWVIDRAIKKKITVYAAGPPGTRSTTVRVGPLVTRHLKGVQLSLTF